MERSGWLMCDAAVAVGRGAPKLRVSGYPDKGSRTDNCPEMGYIISTLACASSVTVSGGRSTYSLGLVSAREYHNDAAAITATAAARAIRRTSAVAPIGSTH